MTTKKAREARRQRNVELTAKDRANRCGHCLTAIPPKACRFTSDDGIYCNFDCYSAKREAREIATLIRRAGI